MRCDLHTTLPIFQDLVISYCKILTSICPISSSINADFFFSLIYLPSCQRLMDYLNSRYDFLSECLYHRFQTLKTTSTAITNYVMPYFWLVGLGLSYWSLGCFDPRTGLLWVYFQTRTYLTLVQGWFLTWDSYTGPIYFWTTYLGYGTKLTVCLECNRIHSRSSDHYSYSAKQHSVSWM